MRAKTGQIALAAVAAAALAIASQAGDALAQEPLSIDIAERYVRGDTVTISGAVRNIDPTLPYDVTYTEDLTDHRTVKIGGGPLHEDGRLPGTIQ